MHLPLLLAVGCARNSNPVPADYIPDELEPTEAYGMVLDAESSPRLVSWALLQALKADVEAGTDENARHAAWKVQCQLANAPAIEDFASQLIVQRHYDPDEFAFDLITGWGPIVGYYVGYWDQDFESASTHMSVIAGAKKDDYDIRHVEYALDSESDGGPPGLMIGVTIRISLARGPSGFWRVYKVGYGKSPDLKD